eukprot:scaffold317_cov379-Prasinococcus_capsulatus_cf.AAC.8
MEVLLMLGSNDIPRRYRPTRPDDGVRSPLIPAPSAPISVVAAVETCPFWASTPPDIRLKPVPCCRRKLISSSFAAETT